MQPAVTTGLEQLLRKPEMEHDSDFLRKCCQYRTTFLCGSPKILLLTLIKLG